MPPRRFDPLGRYVVRSYVKGREVEVVHSAVGPGRRLGRRQRRDFCSNQVCRERAKWVC